MISYFKPLRRKIGVVTLTLACLFAAGWIRSVSVKDEILFQQGASEHRVVLMNGAMAWGARRIVQEGMSEELRQEFAEAIQQASKYHGWLATPVTAEESSYPAAFEWLDWLGMGSPEEEDSWEQGKSTELFGGRLVDYGLAFYQHSVPPFEKVVVWIIPYWSLVFPLILLSAWLLLSKPKQSKPATQPQV